MKGFGIYCRDCEKWLLNTEGMAQKIENHVAEGHSIGVMLKGEQIASSED